MDKITTEEVMDELDMFLFLFGKIDEFFWWYLERISADEGTQFTSTKFKYKFQTRGVNLMLAAPEHQEMNRQVKVTWRTLHTIAHSLMVHTRALGGHIHFALMYMTDHIFLVLPIKYQVN